MRFKSASIFYLLIVVLSAGFAAAEPPSAELFKLLPSRIGGFRQSGRIQPPQSLAREGFPNPANIDAQAGGNPELLSGQVEYRAENGARFIVELAQFRRDSDAYSLLTVVARMMRDAVPDADIIQGQVGTASASSAGRIAFFKGRTFVRVSSAGANERNSSELFDLARLLAAQLDRGDGEIPVLLKHLPDWQNSQKHALYFSGLKSLRSIAPEQPVLENLDSAGDADAVAVDYSSARLLIVEFNTPQLAGENDRQIRDKIEELKNHNQSTPTAYRRVGNYAVFVFNATNEQTANELIDQIQYEQVVQWLGDNPYWLKEAQRRYTETTLGVLIAVVKASGLTLIGCFGLGGLIGGILFSRRRARQTASEAFSDAGGMLRLNLDEMTPQTDPARLLPGRN